MPTFLVQDLKLAVRKRERGQWFGNHLVARVVGRGATLEPGEVLVSLRLRVPETLFSGSARVVVDVPEHAPIEAEP